METSLDLAFVVTTMLVGVRVLAFLLVAPPFHVRAFPGTVKVALALGLALAIEPRAAAAAGGERTEWLGAGTAGMVSALILEVVLGLALGFLVRLVFAAVQAAGSFIDLFGGFEVAQALDPTSGSQGAIFARFYEMAALALLFASDAYQLILAGMARSFEALPLATGFSTAALAELVTVGASELMVAALQIAGPLIAVLFLADLGLGLLTRVAPALNAFALGFPLKIMITLSLGSVAFLALPSAIGVLAEHAAGLATGGGL